MEEVELALRRTIAVGLNGGASNCPPTSSKRSANACRSLCGKNPVFSTDHYPSLTRQLDYFDLRELQDTITSKALWPEF